MMTQNLDPTAALPAVVDVLLVEDDPGDVLMTREAFEEHKLRNTLHVVTDGVQAVAFLRRVGAVAARQLVIAVPAACSSPTRSATTSMRSWGMPPRRRSR